MGIVVGIILAAVILYVIYISGKNRNASEYQSAKKEGEPTPGTGCKSSKSCQHMNLGKASKDGKPSSMCFCRHYNDYVERRDNCEHFLSRGCANGMCTYSNHSEGKCFCSYFNIDVLPKETCPVYCDAFDTPLVQGLIDNLKK